MITENPLWQRLLDYDPDNPAAAFPFSARLARENNWDLAFALEAIHEYKKFMFLLCVSNKPLTPSDEIDQVWHLHLLYTREYWDVFCPKILQQIIHHTPTEGGIAEGEKFTDWYALTFAEYEKHFGKTPPTHLWPAAKIRFKETNFTRVNRHRFWLIRKPN